VSHIHVKKERIIDASPEVVYDALADYKGQRKQVLTPNFLDYTIERGGRGSGTMLRYRLQAAGRERPYHISVQEPVKGQVLVERDTNSSLVTTWSVTPVKDGRQSKVSVESDWTGGNGVKGFFERTFAPLGLRRIYDTILSRLERQVQPGTVKDEKKKGLRLGLGIPFLIVGSLSTAAIVLRYMQKK